MTFCKEILMHLNLQDIISAVEVIGIVLTKVFFNTLLGYLGAIIVFAMIITRRCSRRESVWNLICDAYKPESLRECVTKIRTFWDWKKDVGIWVFFTIGARSIFDFSNSNSTAFLSSVALTSMGSLLLALQWRKTSEESIRKNTNKEAEQGGAYDAEEAV